MPRRTKHNEFFLGSQRWIDEEKDKLTDEELESMTQVAEYLGVSTEPEGLAERIGWARVGNKDLDEKVKQVQKLRDGWVMKKTKKGNTFVSVGEVTPHTIKNKKRGDYKYGRIEITVDPEWIGYTAMVVLSKTKTPKFKKYVKEITVEELKERDPSDYADIVFEDKKEESESSNTTVSDRLVEYGRKRKELEKSKKSKKIVVPKKGYMKTKMTSGTTPTMIGRNNGVLLTTCFFCLS